MTRSDPPADGEPPPERALEEIQADFSAAADRLEALAGELALADLSTELDRDHFPADAAELERMGTGEVCPAVAFEAHGDLAFVVEALGEAVDGLRKAAGRTPETVLAEWQERQTSGTSDKAMPPGALAIRSVYAIQADVLRLAARTARLRADHLERVAELYRDHLPRGPEYERMAEDDVAPSVPYYLAGVLDFVESDLLRKVERELLEAAEKTAASLADEFEERGS